MASTSVLTIAAMDGNRTSPSGANNAYAGLPDPGYFLLTVTPTPGKQISITNLVIYTGKETAVSSSGAFSYAVGTNAPVIVQSAYNLPRVSAGAALVLRAFAITGLTNVSASIEFRWDPATADRVYMDDIEVEGSVIPEPFAPALLGLGGLLAAARRRRR